MSATEDQAPAAIASETQPPMDAAPSAPEVSQVDQDVEIANAPVEKPTETEEKTEAAPASDVKEEQADNGEKQENGEMTRTRQYGNFKKNIKFDPSDLPESDDPAEICKQVEFYFHDSNLPFDKFMWELTGGEENKPVPLKTICSFKRMRHFQPYTAVVAALRESKAIEVSGEEGEEVIKRKKGYVSSTEAQRARMAASVYVKGFGEETKSTQFDIEAFFTKHGSINKVKLRRTDDNKFKGSVFVEFTSEELANSFINMDPAPTWNGNALEIKKKSDYLAEKIKLINEGKIEPNNNFKGSFFEGKIREPRERRDNNRGRFDRGRGWGNRGRDNRGRDNRGRDNRGHDSNDWKKRRDNDQRNGFRHNGQRGGNRGRGNRGRGGRDGRDRDNNGRDENRAKSNNDVKVPGIQATGENGKPVEANGKRAREDDGEAPPAKKVDTKEAVAA
ncbi:La protein [Diplogelasinospora grovesii]|uniref:La protein n=1 Tax=Diplogelasinospora grovesii TaxID=303347 RepID=A0AAN6NFI8_9PEZI|nr:La protein [Diplogelasinospora grovesii]